MGIRLPRVWFYSRGARFTGTPPFSWTHHVSFQRQTPCRACHSAQAQLTRSSVVRPVFQKTVWLGGEQQMDFRRHRDPCQAAAENRTLCWQ